MMNNSGWFWLVAIEKVGKEVLVPTSGGWFVEFDHDVAWVKIGVDKVVDEQHFLEKRDELHFAK